MNSAGRHELPSDPVELARLAYLLKINDPAELERSCATSGAEPSIVKGRVPGGRPRQLSS